MLEEYELVVIGGGIIGAACAYEASSRGVKVLLLEKHDFGSKTSQGSFRIIHGGLRYLQHLDYPRLRESVSCQNYFRRFAPHLVKTLPFLVPCYGYGMKGKEILSIACELYNLLSIDRNRGVSKDQILPRHKVLSREEVLSIAPYVDKSSLRGGVVFYDCQMLDPNRLNLEFILSAESSGAFLENYKEVTKITPSAEGYELSVKDLISGQSRNVNSKFIVNAMGPWASEISKLFGSEEKQKSKPQFYSKGIQLAIRDFPIKSAITVESKGIDTASSLRRGGRAVFLQPWHDYTLIGTTDTIYKGDPKDFSINKEEVADFFNEVVSAYPDPKLTKDKLVHTFGGLRLIDENLMEQVERGEDRDGLVNTSRDELIIDHKEPYTKWGMSSYDNLVTIVGIKYTTCRSVAIKAIDMLSKNGLTRNNRGYDFYSYSNIIDEVIETTRLKNLLPNMIPEEDRQSISEDIWKTYGSRSEAFLSKVDFREISSNLDLKRKIEKEMIKNAFQNEYAKTISDIVERRLSNRFLGSNQHFFIENIKSIASEVLGWKEDKIAHELIEVGKNFPSA